MSILGFDSTKPNLSQTFGDMMVATLANLVALATEMVAHEANSTAAHGIDVLLASANDYLAHKGNTTNAHGIDIISALATAVSAEVSTARGSAANLSVRLAKALGQDGSILLSSLQNKWLDNGDTPTYVDSQHCTVPTDRTKVYIAGAHLRCTISGSYAYAPIASSVYASGVTTVTIDPNYPILTSGLSKIEIGLLSFDYAIQLATAGNTADIVALQAQVSLGIGGRLVKSVAGNTDVVLTNTELLNLFFETTGALTGDINLVVSNSARGFFIYNNTTGAHSLTVKTAAGAGVAVPQGTRALLACDGTNVMQPNPAVIPQALTLPDGSVITFQGTETYIGRATTDKLSNKRIKARRLALGSGATPAINTDSCDTVVITGLATAITSFTTNLTGTPDADDGLVIKITDNGTPRAITWGASFEASTVALPTTTVTSTLLTVFFMWHDVTSKWRCMGVA